MREMETEDFFSRHVDISTKYIATKAFSIIMENLGNFWQI